MRPQQRKADSQERRHRRATHNLRHARKQDAADKYACVKNTYYTKHSADFWAESVKQFVYKCPRCNYWHLTAVAQALSEIKE